MTEVKRRTAEGFVEATFHIPEDVMRALKMKAVQDNKRFSKAAEDALRQYLRLPKEKVKMQKMLCLIHDIANTFRYHLLFQQ